MRTTKHWAMAAMAAAALALAGCGGGGSSSSGGMQAPTPERVSLASVTMDGEGYMAPAATGDDPITIEAGASRTSGSVTFMCAAGGEDCTVTVADNGTVTSTGGMVTAMNSSTYQTALNTAAAAMVEATTKAAGTKETAIATEAVQTAGGTAGTDGAGGADAGLGGSSAPVTSDSQVAGEYNLAIKRDRMATTVTITVEGTTAADNEEFMQTMDLGGGSTMHTRTMEEDDDGNRVEEVVIVSTDIEAPKATAFAMVEGQSLNARADGTTPDDTDTDDTNNSDALTIADGNVGMVMASRFSASSGAGSLTFNGPKADGDTDTEGQQPVPGDRVDGMFNGAEGQYVCTASESTCSVTIADNKVTAATDWVFVPAADATSDVADADYLHYGFWLQRTKDSDDAYTYNEVETFAGSSVDPSNVTDVLGTAIYEGGATGVYVHKVFAPGGTSDATSGYFTADASLEATFGGNRIATDDRHTLTGIIDNFVLENGEANDWMVKLSQDTTSTALDGTAAHHTGTASGGVPGQDGSFTATFHGSVAPGTDGVVPHPGSVVGEFNSVFRNGSVAGAFGARLQP